MQLDSRIKILTTHQNTLFKRKINFLANVKMKQNEIVQIVFGIQNTNSISI